MQIKSQVAGELSTAIGKAAPPIAVTGAAVSGISLQDWVLISTLVYTVLQIAFLVWKIVREHGDAGE